MSRENQFFVPIDPTTDGAKKGNFNHICLNVDHDKDRKVVTLYMHPAEVRDNGQAIIGITQGSYLKLEDMPRLNRKRLEALTNDVKGQINKKRGGAYDRLVKKCEDEGFKLTQTEADAPPTL